MSKPFPQPATYADLEKVPENLVAEILFGTLVTHPRPTPRHIHTSSSLGDELVGPFQKGRGGPGGWWIFDEPEVHLGPHVLVPDLAGWRREHLPTLPSTAWFDRAPDWVCEVVSPSTERYDRGDKRRIYAEFSVPYLWLVNPIAQTLEVHRRQDDGTWLLTGTFTGNDPVSAAPFDAITFALGLLWPFDTTEPGETPGQST